VRTIHRLAAALAAATGALALAAGTALATAPVSIGDVVTDPEGYLSDANVQEIRDAAQQAGRAGIDFYAVTVPDLSGEDVVDWCQAAGEASGLSPTSVVYVIAYEERAEGWCGNDGQATVSDSTLTQARSAARDHLSQSDPLQPDDAAQAIVAFANTMVEGAGDSGGGDSDAGASSGSPSGSGISAGSVVLLLIVLAAVVIGVVIWRGQRRTRQGIARSDRAQAQSVAQKADLANRRLLEADEMVRSASDELEFARAQFGATRTDAYATAVAAAREGVDQSFADQRAMNEADDDASRGAAADRILSRLDSVMNPLAAQQKEFHDLRDSEAGADEQLAGLRERIAEASASIDGAQTELQALSAAYPQTVIASLMDNPDQARALLSSATTAADQAQAALDGGDRARAVEAIDTGLRAVAMARLQTSAIMDAQKNLADASGRLTQAIASLTSDLSDVTRLGADPTAFAPLVEDAQKAVAEARRARDGDGDPLQALEDLTNAEAALDAALANLRSAEDQRAKASKNAAERIRSAEQWVASAQTFIQSRRGLMPLESRSQISRATQSLEQARRSLDSDPAASMSSAEEAESIARGILSSGTPEPPRSGSQGPSVGDALLWSILLGNLGGGHHGGWGDDGPRRGGFGGGFFGGGGFGGGGGGSFGGGGFGGGGGGRF
jgi:citrate synthase